MEIINRVITDQDAQVYHVKTILMGKSDLVEKFMWMSPVKVQNDAGQVIGFASLSRVNGSLVCDLNIDYSSEERLLIETEQAKFYAIPVGTAQYSLKREFQGSFDKTTILNDSDIIMVSISHIRLTTTTHPDSRVYPIREKVLF